jgi:hypothetical protein
MTGVRWTTATALALLVGSGFGLRLEAAVSAAAPDHGQLIAVDRVTLQARPTVAGRGDAVTLSGSVADGKAEEDVTVQAKDCGVQSFRTTGGALLREGGTWSTEYYPGITTTVRAVWNGIASNQVAIQARPYVQLLPFPSRKALSVSVIGRKSFWRRHVLIQRLDRRLGTWKLVKRVVLTETGGRGGSGVVATYAEFNPAVPKGTLVRAMFPRSQARPCYLAGFSNTWRIR